MIPIERYPKWLPNCLALRAAAPRIPGSTSDEKAPYAELWMGTHPSGTSYVARTYNTLASYLSAHPKLMGEKVVSCFRGAGTEEGNLPFLFKRRPDQKMAEALHKEQTDVYKDANHKPEMALALTPFTAMCGFLPPFGSRNFSALILPPITKKFLSAASSADPTSPEAQTALKDLFSSLITVEATSEARLADLVSRYEAGGASEQEAGIEDLVSRLDSQYPGDIGILSAFVLNYVKMQPGKAIFLPAGEPHAYISGDIIECMATSHNVIRAGRTAKLRDIPNLVLGLTCSAGDASRLMVKPAAAFNSAKYTALYDPPIPEFSVLQALVPACQTEAHPPIEGQSIGIVTEERFAGVGWREARCRGGRRSSGAGV
ncbi:hypothetical protein FOMPIDRAFT_1030878 [Fomitopsis schrenkii]|uniref:Mannose-6-phosphate isomerase n=1 Tax=Fomitopsis schrenkii TaxID=2126942 RepID=S8FDD1_FOMSC|nr:hypothetical protein FOMPIDRAFT_1030878 [Fomitopsis schrenkii]